MRSIIPLLTVLSGVHVSARAHGHCVCKVPLAEWQDKTVLETKLKKEGWNIHRIKVGKGCYEIYGVNGQGAVKESYFNPKTLEFVKEAPQQ